MRRFTNSSPAPAEENAAHALGRLGEDLAAKHLRRNGYKVLYRNFRHKRGGEVDIVCRDKRSGELVFVEVKTRTSRDFGAPSHAVDAEKRDLIARGAIAWLRLLDFPDIRYRFDIVEVIAPRGGRAEVTVLENAFPLPERYRV
ncbi:MAG: YraN family protein [Chthoniobacteraceae bacterium]